MFIQAVTIKYCMLRIGKWQAFKCMCHFEMALSRTCLLLHRFLISVAIALLISWLISPANYVRNLDPLFVILAVNVTYFINSQCASSPKHLIIMSGLMLPTIATNGLCLVYHHLDVFIDDFVVSTILMKHVQFQIIGWML